MEFKIIIINQEVKHIIDKDDKTHAECMIEYLNEKYPNHPIFKQMTKKVPVNVMGHFLNKINDDIVIFETTSKRSNHCKSAMIMLPSNFKNQYQLLEQELNKLNDYDHFTILSNCEYEDGSLNGDMTTVNNQGLKKAISNIIDKDNQKTLI